MTDALFADAVKWADTQVKAGEVKPVIFVTPGFIIILIILCFMVVAVVLWFMYRKPSTPAVDPKTQAPTASQPQIEAPMSKQSPTKAQPPSRPTSGKPRPQPKYMDEDGNEISPASVKKR